MRLSLVHWLIAAALVGNVAVFVWSPAGNEPAQPPAMDNLRSLKLLSEVEDLPPRQALVEESPTPVAQVSETAKPMPAPAPAADAAEQPVELAEPETVESPGVAEESVAVETPNADPNPDPELASESDPEPVEEPEPESPPEPVEAPLSEPARCWLAGPVASDALSERLAAEFAAAGTGMDLVLRTVEVSPDHWVYLPTSGSQADIRRLSRELRQSGFDNFQITDGPLAGSLSLGLFRSEERASALRDLLRARGHAAEIFQRPAYQEQPWAAIDDRARESLGWPDAEGAIPGYETLELVSRECPPESDR